MLKVLRRDLFMYGNKMLYLIPIMSISLIILFPKGDEGYFVIGLPLVFIASVMLFLQDEKGLGLQMLLSQPLSRSDVARGRFFSAWAVMGFSAVYQVALGLILSLVYPEARAGFLHHLNFQTLYIYFWFLTMLSLVGFPILYVYMGRSIQAFLLIAFTLNVLLGAFFLLKRETAGANLFDSLEGIILWLNSAHDSVHAFGVSSILLVLINYLNLHFCAWILSRKEF
jgi:hypothetical protein